MKRLRQVFAALILVALIAGIPAAQAAAKPKIVYGHLFPLELEPGGFLLREGGTWSLDVERLKEYAARTANAGADAWRVFPYGVWGPRPDGRASQFSPWQLDPETDKWDLSKPADYYWPIVRQVVEILNAYGMEAWFCWFDMCQLHDGVWTPYSPWLYNVQGISGFYGTKADPYTQAFVRRAVREIEGLDVLWPWGNELGGKDYPGWARRVIFPLVRELGIPYDRMTYGAVMDDAPYLGKGAWGEKSTLQDTARKYFGEDFPPEKNKTLVIREVHKCGTLAVDKYCPFGNNPEQAAYWWGGKPVGPFVLSDDGTKENLPSDDGGRPDAERWAAMIARYSKYSNLYAVEHCPEGGDLEYQVGVLESMSAAVFKASGSWPANYGKWTYVPPVVEPDPETPVTPAQDCSCANWLKRDGGRKPDIWRWIKCLFGGKKRCR